MSALPTIHPLFEGGGWYVYPIVTVTSVYDGDTLTSVIDLGFSVRTKRSIRIVGIDTPEVRGDQRPAGLIVRDYCREIVLGCDNRYYYSHTAKDKYGRALGDVWLPGHGWLGQHLIENHMALPYLGGTKDNIGMDALCATLTGD